MKVLFLIQGRNAAASRYRVLQYIPYLTSRGVEASVSPYPRTFKENIRFFRAAPNYDVVFLQRKRFDPPRLVLLRRKAKRIIYDFDDAVMYRGPQANDPVSKGRRRRFVRMIKASDFVITGNQFLLSEVLPYNANGMVIPTPIDLSRYAVESIAREKKVSLAWVVREAAEKYVADRWPLFNQSKRDDA